MKKGEKAAKTTKITLHQCPLVVKIYFCYTTCYQSHNVHPHANFHEHWLENNILAQRSEQVVKRNIQSGHENRTFSKPAF